MKRADIVVRISLGLGLLTLFSLAVAHADLLSESRIAEFVNCAGVWAPIAFVALYAVATVGFVPGSVLTLASGVLVGPVVGAVYSLLGATIGAALAFMIARYLASESVTRRLGGPLQQLVQGIEVEGWRFVAFVRLVPAFPFNAVNYALGLTRIGLLPYALTSAICTAPGALAYAWLGYAGKEAATGADSAIRSGALALALFAVVAFAPRLIRRIGGARRLTVDQVRQLLGQGKAQVIDARPKSLATGVWDTYRGHSTSRSTT